MNNKQNRKPIILIILSVLGIASLIRGATTPVRPNRSTLAGSEPVATVQKKFISPIEEGLSLKRLSKTSNYKNWSRDPFTAGALIKSAEDSNILEGIIWDTKLPLALIGGKTVKIGDRVGPETVMDIRKDKVILSDGSKERELRLQ